MQYYLIHLSTLANESITAIQIYQPLKPATVKRRFPNAVHLKIDFYGNSNVDWDAYFQILCDTISFKSLILNDKVITKLPNSLWTKELTYLEIGFYKKYNFNQEPDNLFLTIEPPLDFDNHLETIQITQATILAPILFNTKTLRKIYLCNIGISPGLTGIGGASGLESLTIHECDHERFDFDPQALTHLQYCDLKRLPYLKKLPHFNTWVNLKQLHLNELPHLETLENHWDALQNLEQLNITSVKNDICTKLKFNELAQLKDLTIEPFYGASQSIGLGAMPQLAQMRLSHLSLGQVHIETFSSSHLKKVYLLDCDDTVAFPAPLLANLALTTLVVRGMRLPKNILVLKQLEYFESTFPLYPHGTLVKDYTPMNFLDTLKSLNINDIERLTIGQCWLEGLDKVEDWSQFGDAYFKLLNLKYPTIKDFVLENLHYACPKQQKEPSLTDFRGQSFSIVGSIRTQKNMYKQKLISIGFRHHTTIQPDTNFIIIGNITGITLDFPADFWKHSHYFWDEKDLSAFVIAQNPGFLQTDDNSSSLNGLHQLLWSGSVENDELALELLKNGGVSPVLLPDLVIVIKTTGSEKVKAALKRMIKAQLPPSALQLLSHHWIDFEKYYQIAPDFNIVQMTVCHYKRCKDVRSLRAFFKHPPSFSHPERNNLFVIALETLNLGLGANHSNWYFTNDECWSIGLHQKTEVRRLEINCNEHTLISSNLFLPPIRYEGVSELSATVCEKIALFERLESLHITCDTLTTLPVNLLNMKFLKNVIIHNKHLLRLPMAFQVLQNRLKQFEVQGGVFYDSSLNY